eukprot:10121774-Ditylum_brightwellii.AAC.1
MNADIIGLMEIESYSSRHTSPTTTLVMSPNDITHPTPDKMNGRMTSDVDISDSYRNSNTDNQHDYSSSTSICSTIANIAETVGFPIFAGVQS